MKKTAIAIIIIFLLLIILMFGIPFQSIDCYWFGNCLGMKTFFEGFYNITAKNSLIKILYMAISVIITALMIANCVNRHTKEEDQQ